MADFFGTSGDDIQDGTTSDDLFDFSQGGKDRLRGGEGDDTFKMGAALTAAERINGGNLFTDTVVLEGDYDLTLGPKTLLDIEMLRFKAGHDYRIVTDDATAVFNLNAPFRVDGSALGARDVLEFHGEAEVDALFTVTGGAGDDIIITGGGSDLLYGGDGNDTASGLGARDFFYGGKGGDALDGGAGEDVLNGGQGTDVLNGSLDGDQLFGGAGKDTLNGGDSGDTLTGGTGKDILIGGGTAHDHFVFIEVVESTGPDCDWIQDWNNADDTIGIPFIGVSAVDTMVAAGTLNAASFNADLAAAIGGAQLAVDHAVIFKPNAGDLSGRAYLIIDGNNVGGYQADEDLVVDMTGGVGLENFSIFNFL